MKAIKHWKKLLVVGLLGGSFLFQPTAACVDRAQVVTSVSSVITAAGTLYIVDRVLND